VLVVVGDTGRTDNLLPYVQGADGLVIESTYIQTEMDLAKSFGHITAAQAASLAKEAHVKDLYLTHLSRRYRERDVLEEAQTVFPEAIVARDYDKFMVKRDEEDE
jgi:ribonuclease Z